MARLLRRLFWLGIAHLLLSPVTGAPVCWAQAGAPILPVQTVADDSLPSEGSDCGSTRRMIIGVPSLRAMVCAASGKWQAKDLPVCSDVPGFSDGGSCDTAAVCQRTNDGAVCACGSGTWSCGTGGGGGGSGDITAVGNITEGAAFTVDSPGRVLYFEQAGTAGKAKLSLGTTPSTSSTLDVKIPARDGELALTDRTIHRVYESGSLRFDAAQGLDFAAGFDIGGDGNPATIMLDYAEDPVDLASGDVAGILLLEHGGTGASDAAAARANLGAASQADLDAHTSDTGNPHHVTAAQVGKDTAQWNADRLQGTPVGPDQPGTGQVLKFDGTRWAPGTDEVGGHGDGTNCPAGQYARGVDADGNAQGCTPDDVGNDADDDLSDNRLSDLQDVSSASPGTGQVLKWDGASWGPATDSTGNDAADDLSDNDLEDLRNVQGSPSDGQVLKWNATDGKWEPGTDLQGSGGGGGSMDVKEDDAVVVSGASSLDFGAGFDVSENPAGEANVSLDYAEDPVDLGGADVTGTLAIGSGGTGATTADGARSNLDAMGRHETTEHFYGNELVVHHYLTMTYDHDGIKLLDKAGMDEKDSTWTIQNSAAGLKFQPGGTADGYLYTVTFNMRSGTTFSIGPAVFACSNCLNLGNSGLFTGQLGVAQGGTAGATAPDDNLLLGDDSSWVRTALPNCTDGKLLYDASGNAFSCGADETGNDAADDLSDNALDDLGDVSAGSPADGQCLKWDSASSAWVPGDCGSGGGGGGTTILWQFTLLDPSDPTRLRNCDGVHNTCLLGPRFPSQATISGMNCVADPGDSDESVEIDLFDCDSSTGWSCTDVGGATVGNNDTAVTTPGSVAAGHRLAVDINSAPSTVDQLDCTAWGTLE